VGPEALVRFPASEAQRPMAGVLTAVVTAVLLAVVVRAMVAVRTMVMVIVRLLMHIVVVVIVVGLVVLIVVTMAVVVILQKCAAEPVRRFPIVMRWHAARFFFFLSSAQGFEVRCAGRLVCSHRIRPILVQEKAAGASNAGAAAVTELRHQRSECTAWGHKLCHKRLAVGCLIGLKSISQRNGSCSHGLCLLGSGVTV